MKLYRYGVTITRSTYYIVLAKSGKRASQIALENNGPGWRPTVYFGDGSVMSEEGDQRTEVYDVSLLCSQPGCDYSAEDNRFGLIDTDEPPTDDNPLCYGCEIADKRSK